MRKTNSTYQVYFANPTYCGVLARGTRAEMKNLFEQAKEDPEYECVILAKWNERYHCWDEIEKHLMYN